MQVHQLLNLQKLFGDPSKEEFTPNWEKFIELRKKVRIIGEYNSYSFAKLLWIFPLSEKEWKLFDKLEKNGKFGYLSKHLLRCARKVNVPSIYIKEYLASKNDWKFAKKYYRVTKEKQEAALKKYREDHEIGDSLDLIKEERIFNDRKDNIYKSTANLIEAIEEISQREAKLK
jgi:hypothetical protein